MFGLKEDVAKFLTDQKSWPLGVIGLNLANETYNHTVNSTIVPYVVQNEGYPKPPGFEAVFALAGLLAVCYLVMKRK